jgi:hypothetical protein
VEGADFLAVLAPGQETFEGIVPTSATVSTLDGLAVEGKCFLPNDIQPSQVHPK